MGLFYRATACAVCGGRGGANQQNLEIREAGKLAGSGGSRPLCTECGPRLFSAATYGAVVKGAEGAVLVTPAGGLGIEMVPSTHLPPDGAAASLPLNPIVLAILVISVTLIGVFGLLAIFASQLFFLGVLFPFIPLALLALKSN